MCYGKRKEPQYISGCATGRAWFFKIADAVPIQRLCIYIVILLYYTMTVKVL